MNEDVLQNKCADYGKPIVMTASSQLSWSHFVELLAVKKYENKIAYLQ